MSRVSRRVRVLRSTLVCLATVLIAALVPVAAADVSAPAEVTDALVAKTPGDVSLSWAPVSTDFFGNGESTDHYRIYRGTTPDFVPDRVGGSNLLGTSTTESFTDLGAGSDGVSYYYLVSAVDASGNEGNTRGSGAAGAPGIHILR